VRRIYSGIDLNDEEHMHMEGFKLWLEQNNLAVPRGYLDEHHYALRYLNSFHWDYPLTYKNILLKE